MTLLDLFINHAPFRQILGQLLSMLVLLILIYGAGYWHGRNVEQQEWEARVSRLECLQENTRE